MNAFIFVDFGVCWIKLYNSLCMVIEGFIIFSWLRVNCVYGCGVLICIFGGFRSVVIFLSSIEVQSWTGIFTNCCLHEFISGLIVVIKANNILDS